jgi:hypothetical protein
MMGRQDRDQRQLFYEFSLDEIIPSDHLLRRINVFATGVNDKLRRHADAVEDYAWLDGQPLKLALSIARQPETMNARLRQAVEVEHKPEDK